jgi:hypothetical protein
VRKLLLFIMIVSLQVFPGLSFADPYYYSLEQTTANLGISGVYTSSTYEVGNYSLIGVAVSSDVSSATDGLKIRFSNNADCDTVAPSTWDYIGNGSGWTYTTGTTQGYVASVVGKCVQVVYTNGGTAQSAFKLSIFAIK